MRIAVLSGGTSTEREVSLWSGEAVAEGLKERHEVVMVLVGEDKEAWVRKLDAVKPDVVFIALHGGDGENGTVQIILENLKLKYTGSGPEASALCMDKSRAKKVLAEAGVPVARGWLIGNELEFKALREEIVAKLPVVVKPNAGGSSVGVSIVKKVEKLETAVDEVLKMGDEVLVEEFIEGLELTCGVVETGGELKALDVYSVKASNEFFDYDAKYSGKSEEKPAELPEEVIQKVQGMAAAGFKALGCAGYGRIDFILGKNGAVALEMNTLPGLTKNSFMPKMAAKYWSFTEFLEIIIRDALK